MGHFLRLRRGRVSYTLVFSVLTSFGMPVTLCVLLRFLLLYFLPTGTFVSAFTVLCGARTDLPDRHICCVFWLNIAAALIQILTAIVMVGWIMSIFWGMDMVILASK